MFYAFISVLVGIYFEFLKQDWMLFMQNENETIIEKVLKQLDEWRHFPTYQLERRADIFIGLCLPEIICDNFNKTEELRENPLVPEELTVIPEFPLHKGELGLNGGENKENNVSDNDDKESRHSVKVDFVVFSKKENHIFLVELKTDNASIECKQLENMNRATAKRILNGVIKCASGKKSGNECRKYGHLIFKLLELGAIHHADGKCRDQLDIEGIKNRSLANYFPRYDQGKWKSDRPGLSKQFENLEVTPTNWGDAEIDVVLIYPGGCQDNMSPQSKSKVNFVNSIKKNTENENGWLSAIPFCQVLKILNEGHPLKLFLDNLRTIEAGMTLPYEI